MSDIDRSTQFSPDRLYRYTLWREWDRDLLGVQPMHIWELGWKYVQFICLNPSTADETKDDPTIRRCIAFAKSWGYGALCMTNLFAFRATDPRRMMGHPNPVGCENDKWLVQISRTAGLIVAAWGTKGQFLGRDREVLKLLDDLHYLRKTKDGFPEHPLYLPQTLNPIPWSHESRVTPAR